MAKKKPVLKKTLILPPVQVPAPAETVQLEVRLPEPLVATPGVSWTVKGKRLLIKIFGTQHTK